MLKDKRNDAEKQEKSKTLEEKLVKLLWTVLVELKRKVDRRLVKTFLGLELAIVMHRHRNQGLLLSELGSYVLVQNTVRQGPNGSAIWCIVKSGKRVWSMAICGNRPRSGWKSYGRKANVRW